MRSCEPFCAETAFHKGQGVPPPSRFPPGGTTHISTPGGAMRNNQFLPLVCGLFVAGACADHQSLPTALSSRTPSSAGARAAAQFQGVINFCESQDPSRFNITPGGTLHFAGGNRNQWATGNPLIDGTETNEVLVNLDLKNGDGAAHLDVTLQPDAVNGTWEMNQKVTLRGGVPVSSTGHGRGTGDLQGLTIDYATGLPSGTSVCSPDMGTAPLSGVIQ